MLLKEFFSKHARKNTVITALQILDDLRELLDAYVKFFRSLLMYA